MCEKSDSIPYITGVNGSQPCNTAGLCTIQSVMQPYKPTHVKCYDGQQSKHTYECNDKSNNSSIKSQQCQQQQEQSCW